LGMYSRMEYESPSEHIVDWKVFAAWVETEGSIDATITFKLHEPTGKYWVTVVRAVLIGQGEKPPLAALQSFLAANGIYSYLRLIRASKTALGKKPYWRLEVHRMEDIDRIIENIRSSLLTEKARNQVKFYLHVRHMTSDELRAQFLQGWLQARKDKKRRGRKGSPHVY